MKKNEFELDLEIDVTQLDVTAATQAEKFFKWAEQSVEAKKEMDMSKFRLDVLCPASNQSQNRPRKFWDSEGDRSGH